MLFSSGKTKFGHTIKNWSIRWILINLKVGQDLGMLRATQTKASSSDPITCPLIIPETRTPFNMTKIQWME